MIFPSASLSPRQAIRLAVYFALQYPTYPFLRPSSYQQLLLEEFLRGELSMDQLLVHLEAHEYEREWRPTPAQA